MRPVRLLSLNAGRSEPIEAKSGRSGIRKRPQDHPLRVTKEGLQDDAIVDRKHHGGADQALYAYCQPDYDWWAGELGRPLAPGTFGENLTLEGIESADFAFGDQLQFDDLLLAVTSPRIPCVTLGVRMNDSTFPARFLKAGRPGPYFRVLTPGTLSAGATGQFRPFAGTRVPIVDTTFPGATARLSAAKRAALLDAPVHHRLRRDLT